MKPLDDSRRAVRRGARARLSLAVLGCALAGTANAAAGIDDDEIPWNEARVYVELNDTDGDLGFHALMDGEPWRQATIEDPRERTIFKVRPRGRLAAQGMSEVFFESDEPAFDELAPTEFFARFPEGVYEIEGRTLDGRELESEVRLSHVLPAPPANVLVGGLGLPDDCETESGPMVPPPQTIGWDPVTHSHPTLGRPGAIDIGGYQVVIEREEVPTLKLSIDLDPATTALTLPEGLIGQGEQIKIEVLAIEANGNQVARESCFLGG